MDGASTIAVSGALLQSFTALTVDGAGLFAVVGSTVAKPAQEYFTAAAMDGLARLVVADATKSRPEPRPRAHARTFSAFTRSRSFARVRRRR